MRRAIVISLGLVVIGVGLIAAGSAEPSSAATPRLESFGSCGQLLGYLRQQARPLVGPWGIGGGVPIAVDRAAGAPESQAGAVPAPGAGVDFSTTNVQEEGVDEPDIVKSNGRFLYVAGNNTLRIVDVRARTPRLVSTLKLGGGGGHELLLHADRLLVLTRGGAWIDPLPGGVAETRIAPDRLESSLTEIDVRDPSAPKIVRTLALEGSYLSARLVGSSARVVVTSPMPRPIPFQQPSGPSEDAAAAATKRNRAIVGKTGLAAWLPNYELRNARGKTVAKKPIVQCRNVSRPASFSGLGMMTVLTIDLLRGLDPVDSDALVTDGQVVYGSKTRLYVATQRWLDRPLPAGSIAPQKVTTAIHSFDISDPLRTNYRASGTVAGHLLNQWSLSEHQGVLRVASTEFPTWWQGTQQSESESFVTTLRERGDALVEAGKVGGLGRGERVYAVRFMGDKGYVVTFRQVDPLYTLDLSNPAAPKVRGELKILGYSAYLHPLPGDLLLGVGQDATEEGRVLGTQLSLFDVSNPTLPKRLHQQTIGGWSEAEWDHHAFLYWAPERLAVLPTQRGASGFHVSRGGIEQAGVVEHPTRRSVVVRGTLYSVSELGVKAADLRTFTPVGDVPFPPVG